MPMIDVYAATGTFTEEHRLAADLATAGSPAAPHRSGV
jgi:hypothetical protein